ncbi:MAG: amidohydrolase family protein [Vicinamibacterales bacterium]
MSMRRALPQTSPRAAPLSRRSFLGRTLGVGVVAAGGGIPLAGSGTLAAAAQVPAASPPDARPDLVLLNGRVHTMDASSRVAGWVRVRGDRIAAVGDGMPDPRLLGNARVVDLGGRTVIPGLIETHLHGLDTADRPGYHVLELESAGTIRGVQEELAAQRRGVPEGQWLTAIGATNTNLWAERRFPTRQELDDAVPDRPVLLYQGFNGPAATNTLGKQFFDAADAERPLHPEYVAVNVSESGSIAASTPAAGGPSMSALYLLRRMQTFEDRKRNALRTMAYSTSLGLTTWLDKSTIYSLAPLHPRQGSAAVDPYRLRDPWVALHAEGELSIRVQMDFTCFAERDDNAMLRAYLRNALPYFGDDMLRTAGIGEWPAPAAEVEQTRAAQRLVAAARWRCDNDAGTLEALSRVVEQLEAVNAEFDITALRWNVNLLGSGVGWVSSTLLDRLHAMGCSIQLSANNWVNSREPDVVVGHAYRTIAEHPIPKSLFSNATHISPLNPWMHLHYVVTGLNTRGQQVNPGEQLSRGDALRLRTREAAWLLRMEDRLGSLEAGRLADLAVLDRDYFSVPDEALSRVRAVLTVVNGRAVHDPMGLVPR